MVKMYLRCNDCIFPLQDIDIKKVNGVPQYAFVQYSDIASVCKAIKKMDGEYLGSNRLKVMSSQYTIVLFMLLVKPLIYGSLSTYSLDLVKVCPPHVSGLMVWQPTLQSNTSRAIFAAMDM